jgi:hypothetical protein
MLARARELATNGAAEAADNKTATSQNANFTTLGNVGKKNKNSTETAQLEKLRSKRKAQPQCMSTKTKRALTSD